MLKKRYLDLSIIGFIAISSAVFAFFGLPYYKLSWAQFAGAYYGTVTPTPTPTATPPPLVNVNVTLLDQIGGSPHAVSTDGNRLAIAAGPRVLLFDVTNPAAPVQLGESPLFRLNVRSVALAGDLVYAGDAASNIYVLDFATPSNPIFRGSRPADSGFGIQALTRLGNYLYAVDSDLSGGTLRILDISNPDHPVVVGNASARRRPR